MSDDDDRYRLYRGAGDPTSNWPRCGRPECRGTIVHAYGLADEGPDWQDIWARHHGETAVQRVHFPDYCLPWERERLIGLLIFFGSPLSDAPYWELLRKRRFQPLDELRTKAWRS